MIGTMGTTQPQATYGDNYDSLVALKDNYTRRNFPRQPDIQAACTS